MSVKEMRERVKFHTTTVNQKCESESLFGKFELINLQPNFRKQCHQGLRNIQFEIRHYHQSILHIIIINHTIVLLLNEKRFTDAFRIFFFD